MRIECFKGKGRQPWRWRLVANNGRIIADSAEGYATRRNLVRALLRLVNALNRPIPWRWR